MPNLVTVALLRRLAALGSELCYHGDFDRPGVAITNRMIATVGCTPLAMTAADYLAAAHPDGLPLDGPMVLPSWDASLADAMAARGVAGHEESVLDALLAGAPDWRDVQLSSAWVRRHRARGAHLIGTLL